MQRTISKASVYFRHGSWNHRYAKVYENGQMEYGTISGFEDETSAMKSFWEYLSNYRNKLKEIKDQQTKLQQSNYDEDLENFNMDSDEEFDCEELDEDYE